MNIFLKKVIVFTVLLIGLLSLIKYSVPYYWANRRLAGKMDYFLQTEDQYKTAVIGSSLINRSFIPNIFDKELELNEKSFNLAMGGTYFLEAHYILDRFIEGRTIENIIFLVQRPTEIAESNIGTTRSKYYLDFKQFFFAMEFFIENVNQRYIHVQSFIENSLCIGELGSIFRYHVFPDVFEIQSDGFYDFKLKNNGIDNKQKERVRKRLGTGEIEGINKKTNSIPTYGLPESEILFFNTLKKIDKDLETAGITCYFVYLPNDRPPEMMNSCKNIYMGDGVDFPEYFYEKNRMDRAHLNIYGAEIFSKRLGRLINTELARK